MSSIPKSSNLLGWIVSRRRNPASRSTARVSNPPVAIVLLQPERVDLVLKRLDFANSLLDRRLVATGLIAPAVVVVDVLRAAALFRLDLEAGFTLVLELVGVPDHLHAAGFAGAVLGLTVLLEVAPLPVTACIGVLLVEAHGDEWVLGGVSVCVSGGVG
jgi:hypothetical protein